MSFRHEEDGTFRGAVTFLNLKPNAGCIKKAHIEAAAGIEATKLEHQHRAVYAQESATTAAAAKDEVIHVVKGTTGTLKSFEAGCVVACLGDSVVTVDLHKNGVSILVAAVDIDSGDAAYDLVAGVIDTAAVVHDDVLEVVVTVAVGTGTLGKGVFAYMDIHEAEA